MQAVHYTVAAIVERENSFLYVEEIDAGKHVINQPAGHVEPGESFVDAVVREMREETSRDFTPTAITGIYDWTHPDTQERFLRVVYTGDVTAPNPNQALDDDILRTLWLSRDELVDKADMHRSPMVLIGLDDYLAGNRMPVDLVIETDSPLLETNAQRVA